MDLKNLNLVELDAQEVKVVEGGLGNEDPKTITILGNVIYIGGTGPLIP